VEVLVAVGILAAIGGGVTYALLSGFRGSGLVNQYATAEMLARTQVEDIRNAPYDDTLPLEYDSVSDLPTDYSINVDVVKLDGDTDGGVIQTITVTVIYNGQTVVTMDTFKVKYELDAI